MMTKEMLLQAISKLTDDDKIALTDSIGSYNNGDEDRVFYMDKFIQERYGETDCFWDLKHVIRSYTDLVYYGTKSGKFDPSHPYVKLNTFRNYSLVSAKTFDGLYTNEELADICLDLWNDKHFANEVCTLLNIEEEE